MDSMEGGNSIAASGNFFDLFGNCDNDKMNPESNNITQDEEGGAFNFNFDGGSGTKDNSLQFQLNMSGGNVTQESIGFGFADATDDGKAGGKTTKPAKKRPRKTNSFFDF